MSRYTYPTMSTVSLWIIEMDSNDLWLEAKQLFMKFKNYIYCLICVI